MTSSQWEPASQNGQAPAGVDKQVARYAEMKDELAAIQASVTSSDKTVTVVAGPAGAVLDVRVSEQAMKGSARSLSSSIMSTLRLAVAAAARQQAEVVQQYVGDRLNILDRVMATQQEVLGDKIEAGEQEQQRLAEQSRSTQEEDDGSMLRSVTQQAPAPQPAPPQPAAPQRSVAHPPAPQPPAPHPPAPPRPAPQRGPVSPRQRTAEDYDDNEDYDPFAWR